MALKTKLSRFSERHSHEKKVSEIIPTGSDLDMGQPQGDSEEKQSDLMIEKKRIESALLNRENSGIVERNVLPNDEMLEKHLSSMKKDKEDSSFITGSYSKGINELPSLKSLKGNLVKIDDTN